MKQLFLKVSMLCRGLLVLYSTIIPSPRCVGMLFVLTVFPLLADIVLNLIFASVGKSVILSLIFTDAEAPKFSTTIKTLFKPSISLT